MTPLATVALIAALLVLVPCLVLALECLAACLPQRRERFKLVKAPRTVVLVPAHDEEDCLPDALRSLVGELDEEDGVLVVAHNCSDRTAMIARALDAEVCEVRDDGTRGKPAALEAGLAYLREDPPEVVVIVDADCRVEPHAVRTLAAAAAETGGPVQGDYRFASGSDDEFGSLSSLALLVKNVVRPTGQARLGWPCLLNGAGSAYPYEQLSAVPHGRGSIAEDYQLAIDLARRGHPTRFVPEARVRSVLPGRHDVALKQRKRWEHGHLALVLGTAPALLLQGLLGARPALFLLGLDLLVPPLALLLVAVVGSLLLSCGAWLAGGGVMALAVSGAAAALLAGGLSCGLARFAGLASLLRVLRSAPGYAVRKLGLYASFLGRRETRWRKTERTSPAPGPDADGGKGGSEHTGT